MNKFYKMVKITARKYFDNNEYEDYTAIFSSSDHVGINNYLINFDEIIKSEEFTEVKKVNLIEWLK